MKTLVLNADIVRSWLVISGISQERLAQELRVSRTRIRRLLQGEAEPPARVIGSLLALTQLPFDRLFSMSDRPSACAQRAEVDGRFSYAK
jgi:transcriptional regulator with XRE-family HTH domain